MKLSASGAVVMLTPLAACAPRALSNTNAPAELVLSDNLVFFDRDGRAFSVLPSENAVGGELLSISGELNNPVSLAFDRAGNLFVLDRKNVQIFDHGGTRIGQLSGDLHMPSDITIDRNDRVYVADTLNHRVQVFEGDTVIRAHADGMNAPRAVALFSDDTLLVLDAGNTRLLAYDKDGGLASTITLKSPKKVILPRAMTIDRHDRIYVADLAYPGLHVIDRDGTYVEHRPLEQNGLAMTPLHLATDANGDVHVAAIPARAA